MVRYAAATRWLLVQTNSFGFVDSNTWCNRGTRGSSSGDLIPRIANEKYHHVMPHADMKRVCFDAAIAESR